MFPWAPGCSHSARFGVWWTGRSIWKHPNEAREVQTSKEPKALSSLNRHSQFNWVLFDILTMTIFSLETCPNFSECMHRRRLQDIFRMFRKNSIAKRVYSQIWEKCHMWSVRLLFHHIKLANFLLFSGFSGIGVSNSFIYIKYFIY